jgi:hypothetical protein
MRTCILVIAAGLSSFVVAQKSDTLPSFTFAKRTSIFMPMDPLVFGKGWYAYNTSFFIDNTLRLNNRHYLKCGPFFRKFERYCVEKGLGYDTAALTGLRKKLVPANIIYFSSFPTMVIPFVRAFNSNFTNFGKALFFENYNYLFWVLVAGEIVAGVEIKAKAERRFNSLMGGRKARRNVRSATD